MSDPDALISRPHDWLRTEAGWIKVDHIVHLWMAPVDEVFGIYGRDMLNSHFILHRKFESEDEAEAFLRYVVGVPPEPNEREEDEEGRRRDDAGEDPH